MDITLVLIYLILLSTESQNSFAYKISHFPFVTYFVALSTDYITYGKVVSWRSLENLCQIFTTFYLHFYSVYEGHTLTMPF